MKPNEYKDLDAEINQVLESKVKDLVRMHINQIIIGLISRFAHFLLSTIITLKLKDKKQREYAFNKIHNWLIIEFSRQLRNLASTKASNS